MIKLHGTNTHRVLFYLVVHRNAKRLKSGDKVKCQQRVSQPYILGSPDSNIYILMLSVNMLVQTNSHVQDWLVFFNFNNTF